MNKPTGNGTEAAPRLLSYDFWAVGTNCCGEPPNDDFECGEYSNPLARAGLRVLAGESENDLYMSAVKQAEANYGIRAANPLFSIGCRILLRRSMRSRTQAF